MTHSIFYLTKTILAIRKFRMAINFESQVNFKLWYQYYYTTFYMVMCSCLLQSLVYLNNSKIVPYPKSNKSLVLFFRDMVSVFLGLACNLSPSGEAGKAMVAVCPVLVWVEGKYESNIWMHTPGSVLREAFIGQLIPSLFLLVNHQGHHLLHWFSIFLGSSVCNNLTSLFWF